MLSAVIISKNEACNRLLSKPGILFSGQEKINEEPECTESVHEDSEFIFDEPREQKTGFPKKSNIEGCIQSLSWIDDIHVVDSGSTDNTVALAQNLGATVHYRPFTTYAEQHNWAHREAGLKHPWVLHLDADERSTPAFQKSVLECLSNTPPKILAYYCCWKLMLGKKWLKYSDGFPRWQLRLVRKELEPYIEFGHAQKEKNFEDGSLGYIQEPYLHFPWSKGWAHWLEKHNTYSSKEAIERLHHPLDWKQLFSPHPSKRIFAVKAAAARLGLLWPFFRFFYHYILRGGFLDGYAGLVYLLSISYYELCITLKMEEIKASPEGLSKNT